MATRLSNSRYSVITSERLPAKTKANSGFPSKRINLSPFTKDFRGGEQLNESFVISYRPTFVGHTIQFIFGFKIKRLAYAYFSQCCHFDSFPVQSGFFGCDITAKFMSDRLNFCTFLWVP